MSEAAEPLAVVKAFIDAFEAMDFDAALSHVAESAEYTNIPMGTAYGHDGIRGALGPFFAPIHENEFVILRMGADGPLVFVERVDRHRLDHGWRELPVTGVFEVHDGRITVWREYFDLATAAAIHDPGQG